MTKNCLEILNRADFRIFIGGCDSIRIFTAFDIFSDTFLDHNKKSNHYRHLNFYLYHRKMKPLLTTPNLEDKILKNIIRNMFSIPSKIMVSILSNIIINRRFEIIQRTYQIKSEVSRKSFLIFQNH